MTPGNLPPHMFAGNASMILSVLRRGQAYRVDGHGGMGIQRIALELGYSRQWREVDQMLRELQREGLVDCYVDAPSRRAWFLVDNVNHNH